MKGERKYRYRTGAEGEEEFVKRIGEVLWEKIGMNEEWKELKTNIDLAIRKKRIRRKESIIGRKSWWDEECWEGKKKLRKVFKKGDRSGREEEIKVARLEYRQLCDRKREEWKKGEERLWREINTDSVGLYK